jgi:hypothetical protein
VEREGRSSRAEAGAADRRSEGCCLSPGSRDRTEGEYGEDVVDENERRRRRLSKLGTDGYAIRGWAHTSEFGGRVWCRWVRKKLRF